MSDEHAIREYAKESLELVDKRKAIKNEDVSVALLEDELIELKELTKEKFDNTNEL